MKEEDKDLNYWKENAEECYMTTPIGVLRYITELEKAVENITYEPMLATVLDLDETVVLCKPNYLAKDGSIKPAERHVDQKSEKIVYYAYKSDMYGC